MKVELEFTKERETKNTIRYAEEPSGGDVTVGTIYIRKEAFEDEVPPERLRVSITSEDPVLIKIKERKGGK